MGFIGTENLVAISASLRNIEQLDSHANAVCRLDQFRAFADAKNITEQLSGDERNTLRRVILGNWHARIRRYANLLTGWGIQVSAEFTDREAWIAAKLALLPPRAEEDAG